MNDNWFKKYGWLIPLSLLFLATAFMMLAASNQAKINRTMQEFLDFRTPYISDSSGSRVVNLAYSALSVTASNFEEAPAEEAPAEESPVKEPPVEESPVEESPVKEPPVEESPVKEPPVEEAPVKEPPVEEAPEGSISEDNGTEGNASEHEYSDYAPETMTDEILLEIRDALNLFLDILLLVIAVRLVYLVFFNFRYLWRY